MKIDRTRFKHVIRLLWDMRRPSYWWLIAGAYRTNRKVNCPPDVWQHVDPIDGFLSSREASILNWFARTWPLAGPVIEIGSFAGRSTIALALGQRHIHCIDPWQTPAEVLMKYNFAYGLSGEDIYQKFLLNIQHNNLNDRVTVHRGTSLEVSRNWQEPCAILWIDGSHLYQDVYADLHAWLPHLMPGGLLLMHDVISLDCPEVKQAVIDTLASRDWRIIGRANSLVAFVRR